jgi:hypothetical protein
VLLQARAEKKSAKRQFVLPIAVLELATHAYTRHKLASTFSFMPKVTNVLYLRT